MEVYKEQQWRIGEYCPNADSVCVNLDYEGRRYHRHDYGSIWPRWVRIGWFVRSIERESRCVEESRIYVAEVRARLKRSSE